MVVPLISRLGCPQWMALLACALLPGMAGTPAPAAEPAAAAGPWRWTFDQPNNPQGWSVSPELGGRVMGGALWLTVASSQLKHELAWGNQVYATTDTLELLSPAGLEIPAAKVRKVKLRVLNGSPETDGFLFWRLASAPDKETGPIRFTMKPDLKEWQEVVINVDDAWTGLPAETKIDRLRIVPALMKWRGDIWIDSIEVCDGTPRPAPERPDVVSERVVPQVKLPAVVTQETFGDAFKVLDECLITNVPVYGFTYPVMAPGGAYGENWWQLDSGLNISGTKWVNQAFVENVMRGFFAVQAQNPDGRIDLWGGSPGRGQVCDTSSIPRYFEVAWDVARRTGDVELREQIYQSMRAYLDWWLSPVKADAATGLVTAVAEETFGEPNLNMHEMAPVDLNVAVALGCHNVAALARALGHTEEARQYEAAFTRLAAAINQYQWDEAQGFYVNYNTKTGQRAQRLVVSTFDTLRLGIAPPERQARLLTGLQDPKLFNWGVRPLTSIAKTDPGYVEALGPYDGRAWLGDIWTMRNLPVIAGLADIGRHDLAGELAWQTIKIFNGKTTEYIAPATGSGEGQPRYGWSASQYIQTVIEWLFGVDADLIAGRVRIMPHVPQELQGQTLTLSQLLLPTGVAAPAEPARLALSVLQSAPGEAEIEVTVSGPLPAGALEVYLPMPEGNMAKVTDAQGKELELLKDGPEVKGAAGVHLPLAAHAKLKFTRR